MGCLLCKTKTFKRQVSAPKNNCLILGAGRSGTSLTGLLLERAGYHVYTETYPPDDGNPLGYFEDIDVVSANDAILGPFYRSRWRRLLRRMNQKPNITGTGAWLLDLDPGLLKSVSLESDQAEKFRELFAHTPFAYKDPRFSFTLGVLAPIIPKNTLYICVFRHPLHVVKSTRKHALRSGVFLDDQYCLELWAAHYLCLLEHYQLMGGQWLFVSYEQLINGDAVPRMQEFLTVELDGALVKPELGRTQARGALPDRIVKVFGQLQELERASISTQAPA